MDKWDQRFLRLAWEISSWSKDPSTRVGAVAVSGDRVVLSSGWNGFPRGFDDTAERLNDRPTKYKYVVHAEENCLFNAARVGASLHGSTLYVVGLPVCCSCARGVVQAGVLRVVAAYEKPLAERWCESCGDAEGLFDECGVVHEDVDIREIED